MKKISFAPLSPALTSLGKKLGIDAHYFAKNSSFVLVGHTVSILRGLLTGYLVARFFQKEIYGEYQLILSVTGTLALFGLPGLVHAVSRAWARDEAFSLKVVTKFHLKACLVGSLILLFCIPFLKYYNREELWPLFLVAAILFPLPPIAQIHYGSPVGGKGRFDIMLKVNIIWSVLMIIATLAIIFFHQSALLMLTASMGIPSLVYLYYSRRFRPPKEEGLKNTKAIVRYGWRLTFATLPTNIVWYIDKLLISYLFGLEQLATFSVALLIPEQVKIFSKQLVVVSFMKQARGKDSWERRIKLMKAVLIGMIFFAVGIGFYVVLCPIFIPLLFPNYDAEEVILLTRVAAITLVVIPGSLFVQHLEARGMIREVRFSHWSAAIVFGIAIFILVPLYGLLGAILARGLFRFVYVGSSGWFVMRTPIQKIS